MVDYEKIDQDARVSQTDQDLQFYTIHLSKSSVLGVQMVFLHPHVLYPQALYDAGVKRKGTDVTTWISIMSERSVPHLQRGTLLHNAQTLRIEHKCRITDYLTWKDCLSRP